MNAPRRLAPVVAGSALLLILACLTAAPVPVAGTTPAAAWQPALVGRVDVDVVPPVRTREEDGSVAVTFTFTERGGIDVTFTAWTITTAVCVSEQCFAPQLVPLESVAGDPDALPLTVPAGGTVTWADNLRFPDYPSLTESCHLVRFVIDWSGTDAADQPVTAFTSFDVLC